MLRKEDIEALTCLGLSNLQARVYLALVNLSQATTKMLAKNSNVARQDIYRIASELQEIGIVEKVLSTPNEYRATPLQDGIKILLHRKQKENSEAQKKAIEFLQRRKDEKEKEQLQEGKSEFVLIPKDQAISLRIIKAIDSTQKSLDTACSWARFQEGMDILFEALEKALLRGVTIRLVVKKPKDTDRWPRAAKLLTKYPQFKVRTIQNPLAEIVGIYDKKETLIATSTAGGIASSPALWSDNACLVAIAQDAFEKMWQAGKKPKGVAKKIKEQGSKPERNSENIYQADIQQETI